MLSTRITNPPAKPTPFRSNPVKTPPTVSLLPNPHPHPPHRLHPARHAPAAQRRQTVAWHVSARNKTPPPQAPEAGRQKCSAPGVLPAKPPRQDITFDDGVRLGAPAPAASSGSVTSLRRLLHPKSASINFVRARVSRSGSASSRKFPSQISNLKSSKVSR